MKIVWDNEYREPDPMLGSQWTLNYIQPLLLLNKSSSRILGVKFSNFEWLESLWLPMCPGTNWFSCDYDLLPRATGGQQQG
jgi:hypothetical protein